jgi:hypothetical protein
MWVSNGHRHPDVGFQPQKMDEVALFRTRK